MRTLQLLAVGGLVLAGGRGRADTTVELKDTHLCCGQCVKAVETILGKVDGASGTCDQKAGTVTITAKDVAAAQKAVDALTAGGFHGKVEGKVVTVKDDSGVAKGKVSKLTLEGVHNCCGACTKAIVTALGKVTGVTGNTAKAKSDAFDVTGDFDAEAVVKALNAAGYHVRVKK